MRIINMNIRIPALFALLSLALLVSAQPALADNAFEKALEKLLGNQSSRNEDEIRVPENQAEIQLSFAPLVRKVSQSVVNVYAARKAVQSPFAGDPFC